jgi:hypothetical protein
VGLLPGGKYDAVQRDPVPGRRAVLASIRRQLAGLMPAREGNAA